MESLRPILSPILPGKCFNSILLDWNYNDSDCIKIAISKCLGYGMILGGSLVKLPQILKITASESAVGLSIPSVVLDLSGVTATTAYNYNQKYPFSTYGEGVFLMIETALILFLALKYSARTSLGVIFVLLYSALCGVIVVDIIPAQILLYGQLLSAPVAITGKLLQAMDNYKAGHTGQLSFITVMLLFLGCIARVFTSLTETGDTVIIASFAMATLANLVLVYQVIAYWNVTNEALRKAQQKKSK